MTDERFLRWLDFERLNTSIRNWKNMRSRHW